MSKVTKILFLDLKSKIDCEIEIQIFWNSKMSDSQDFKLQVRVPLSARVIDWKSGTWTTRHATILVQRRSNVQSITAGHGPRLNRGWVLDWRISLKPLMNFSWFPNKIRRLFSKFFKPIKFLSYKNEYKKDFCILKIKEWISDESHGWKTAQIAIFS